MALLPVVLLGYLLRGLGPALYGVNQQTLRQQPAPPGTLPPG